MKILACSAAVILAACPAPAECPIEPTYAPDGQWLCDVVLKWKAVMRRDYPGIDRSVPEVERRCHLPQETWP